MARRRYNPKTKENSTFTLNITSMTDMFTILLVFLLQTYSTSEMQLTPDQNQNLPLSSQMTEPTPAVQVSLTKTELKFQDRTIASINESNFQPKDIDPNDSNFVLPLFNELQALSKAETAKKEKFDAGDKTVKVDDSVIDGKIILKADSEFSYQTLRKLMYTASMAGFPKVKLATVVGN